MDRKELRTSSAELVSTPMQLHHRIVQYQAMEQESLKFCKGSGPEGKVSLLRRVEVNQLFEEIGRPATQLHLREGTGSRGFRARTLSSTGHPDGPGFWFETLPPQSVELHICICWC